MYISIRSICLRRILLFCKYRFVNTGLQIPVCRYRQGEGNHMPQQGSGMAVSCHSGCGG